MREEGRNEEKELEVSRELHNGPKWRRYEPFCNSCGDLHHGYLSGLLAQEVLPHLLKKLQVAPARSIYR